VTVGLSGTAVNPELAEGDHRWLFYAKGCTCPEFNGMDVTKTLAKFVDHFLPKCPVVDPRGKSILIFKSNFPKLADLAHLTLSREVFSASKIVESIENGTFKLSDYEPQEQDRMQTLFWIPDVLADPDAIYRNGHTVVAGDEVYVKVFDKPKPQVKMVFTMDKPAGKKIKTVPVTSFLTSRNRAIRMIKGSPLYLKK
jgi:hypothetical protein